MPVGRQTHFRAKIFLIKTIKICLRVFGSANFIKLLVAISYPCWCFAFRNQLLLPIKQNPGHNNIRLTKQNILIEHVRLSYP